MILEGKKTWEIRGTNTQIRGRIAVIKSGSGTIIGTVELTDSKKISLKEYKSGECYHCVPEEDLVDAPYKNTHAWIMKNPIIFDKPISYKHPMGAVIWVNLFDFIID